MAAASLGRALMASVKYLLAWARQPMFLTFTTLLYPGYPSVLCRYRNKTDGYAGYNKVENIKRIYCLAHIRRKFHDIIV
ncbi:IS66 family transposase, partial [Alkaliphilus hydrothermalis]|uniref:IS66 family transposase n=1 Tax=Alkaliphilus hydrothermalis TaxID=1482730 RepID=UPI00195D3074